MNITVMHQVMQETQAGQLTFPQVVQRLAEVGVESYFVDAARSHETLYLVDGATHAEKMILALDAVAENFSTDGLIAAIRAAQSDTIRYPEFMQRAAAAGVLAYWVFITGRKVIYFGRKGETHVEHFPGSNS